MWKKKKFFVICVLFLALLAACAARPAETLPKQTTTVSTVATSATEPSVPEASRSSVTTVPTEALTTAGTTDPITTQEYSFLSPEENGAVNTVIEFLSKSAWNEYTGDEPYDLEKYLYQAEIVVNAYPGFAEDPSFVPEILSYPTENMQAYLTLIAERREDRMSRGAVCDDFRVSYSKIVCAYDPLSATSSVTLFEESAYYLSGGWVSARGGFYTVELTTDMGRWQIISVVPHNDAEYLAIIGETGEEPVQSIS
ncbi:MAG: hypothetical protein E7452_05655 [Ruminococcaceae bacterium]|nr:hypothetical protein [Oscillospiraceae bacterium]